ncbi:TonB-dependent receptor [Gimibacter soli]|uniref:TonB-dependent receptor n=1 Tax=Gimibacter soli TaxID=3024400 RepID=A0AAE9XLU7_9PROT|nr:TonB-dependent receptor [Gimibacter soli]WCL53273.1 TonB-dependent receptor [Gimibacter soli]
MRNFIQLYSTTAVIAVALASAPALGADAGDDDVLFDEIIVTANKREQSLRDVPGSISAVGQSDLKALSAQSLSDYITRVPGVVFNDYQPGVSEVVIRGIASTTYHEANQATTGYYLNQIPLIEPGFPLVIPDVDAFDLKQVEVLRGPQGTLFGSSSLGGAINYVVNEADASGYAAAFEGTVSSTRRAGEASYAIKAMANIPIVSDQLALRVTALQRDDAGYLDNLGTGEDGSNDLTVRGVRGSLVWTPSAETTVSVLSMYQEYGLDDQTYALFDMDRYERSTNVDEYQDTQFFLNSLTIEQDFDFATLTLVGSHTEKENDLAFDDSVFLGMDPRTDTAQLSGSAGKSKTDYLEARLTSNSESALSWIIGANYTKLKSNSTDGVRIPGIAAYIDNNPGEFGDQPSSVIAPDDFTQRTVSSNEVKELALFGEASYDFTEALTLTLGGRVFEYKSTPRLQFLPNAALIDPFDYQPGADKKSDFIPKVSLTYKPTDNFMAYALYSEGFRIGGVNVYAIAAGTPLTFESDTTKNYEIGTRFDLLDKVLSFDISAYHIKWDNIQARLFTPVTFNAYTTNGGGAKVDGVELTAVLRPTDNVSFSTNLTYTDARLSDLLPDSFAVGGGYAEGSRLPGSSEWMMSNQLDFSFEDVALKPRFGIAHRYLSDAPVAFGAVLEKGGYHLVDLNASFEVKEGLEVVLFAKNIFDEYGILNAPFSFAGAVTRPRTIGATLRFALN